jgi:hypothetical protein
VETFELTIRIPKPSRRWLQYRLRTLLLFTLLAAAAIGWWVSPRSGKWSWSELHSAVLLSRLKYNNYEKATFSFEFGIRDDPDGLTRNDWDLEFGNGGDFFHVTMVTDDRSRLIDLGEHSWKSFRLASLPELPPYPEPSDDPHLPAKAGHIYMVHTKDRESDLYALFRVEALVPGDHCTITWRLISPDRGAAAASGSSRANTTDRSDALRQP